MKNKGQISIPTLIFWGIVVIILMIATVLLIDWVSSEEYNPDEHICLDWDCYYGGQEPAFSSNDVSGAENFEFAEEYNCPISNGEHCRVFNGEDVCTPNYLSYEVCSEFRPKTRCELNPFDEEWCVCDKESDVCDSMGTRDYDLDNCVFERFVEDALSQGISKEAIAEAEPMFEWHPTWDVTSIYTLLLDDDEEFYCEMVICHDYFKECQEWHEKTGYDLSCDELKTILMEPLETDVYGNIKTYPFLSSAYLKGAFRSVPEYVEFVYFDKGCEEWRSEDAT